MKPITMYTKPRCVQCDASERRLGQLGATEENGRVIKIDITLPENNHLLAELVSEGFQQAPIVEFNGEKITGFRPDHLTAFATAQEKILVRV